MPYPDIKDSRVVEVMTFILFSPEILLVATAPVWVTTLLVFIGLGNFWDSLWISVLLWVGVACLAIGFLPESAWSKVRKTLGSGRFVR